MAKSQIDGKPIIDATKPIALEILDSDIAKASRKEPLDCVISRACRRDLGAKEVRVYLARIYVRYGDGGWQRFATPAALRSEIIAFDRGGAFAPGAYVLNPVSRGDIASRGKRKGGTPKYNHARNNPKRKKRPAPHVLTDVRTGPFG